MREETKREIIANRDELIQSRQKLKIPKARRSNGLRTDIIVDDDDGLEHEALG
jgi:hypothetical protein